MLAVDSVYRASTALVLLTGKTNPATPARPGIAQGLDPTTGNRMSPTAADALMRIQQLAQKHGADKATYRTIDQFDDQTFQGKVLDFLKETYKNDAGFQRALKDGTLKIQRGTEVEGLNASSSIVDLSRGGSHLGSIGLYSASDARLNAQRAEGGTHTAGVVDNLAYYASW